MCLHSQGEVHPQGLTLWKISLCFEDLLWHRVEKKKKRRAVRENLRDSKESLMFTAGAELLGLSVLDEAQIHFNVFVV